ncbi:MAG TPA: ankyrin repeat domain-containing protein [Bryobacteraceae bacterium]|nr:ankyrin repeat domain-containing protein [Bryobacteraceae bacterium]
MTLTVHAASGLGLADQLVRMLDADPSLVHAKGGDGGTPLHFSRDVAFAKLLLDRGAQIDARDEDHDSTPAQWLIGDVPDVARFLVERGASPDIFLAAALGDPALAEKLIEADPKCPGYRIGKLPEFPPLGSPRGGTIYQWTLAFNSYPHQIALKKGHQDLFELLYEKSDTATRLLVSCVLGRRAEAEAIAAASPGIIATLPASDLELPARYCWETNTNFEAVRLMLDVGFPAAHPERSHGYTPLHNAAWSGTGDLVDLLIARGHPVDMVDPTYNATPLGFAIHDCVVEKRHPEGEFGRVVKSLLDAGSPWEPLDYPFGDARIDEVFKPLLHERLEGAAMMGDEAAVDRLIGATKPDPEELTRALGGAAKGGHVALCRRFLEAGAVINGKIGHSGNTPLIYAAGSASKDTIAFLLENGADARVKNGNGTSALDVAQRLGPFEEIVRLLS